MTSAAFADLMAVLEEQESSSTAEPAGPKEETVSIETITSEQAKKIIKANFDSNRTIVKANLVDLRADIESGDFHLSTDAIAFDQNNQLVNGQHRMEVLSQLDGHSARFIVVRNLTPESVQVLDLGKRRMIHDRITVAGTKMTKSESAILRNAMVDYGMRAIGTEYFCHRHQDKFIKDCYERHMYLLREITDRYKKLNSSIGSAAFVYCLQRLEDEGLLTIDDSVISSTQKFYGTETEKVEVVKDILDGASHFIELATNGNSDVRPASNEDSAACLLFKRVTAKRSGKGAWGSKEDWRATMYAAHRFYARKKMQSLNSIPQTSPFEQSYLVEQTNSNDAISSVFGS